MKLEEYDDYNESHISKKWNIYNQKVSKTNSFLIENFEKLDFLNLNTVLDLGCGPGNESNFFIEKGFDVTAVDYNQKCLQTIEQRFPKLVNHNKFNFVHSRIENYEWNTFDVVISLKALPFLSKNSFRTTLLKIAQNISPNGIFIAKVFGEKDDWQECALTTKEEVEEIFSDFMFLEFNDIVANTTTVADNEKSSHLIDFIVQKK